MSVKSAKKENIDMLHSLSWWGLVNPIVESVGLTCSVSNHFLLSGSVISVSIFVVLCLHMVAFNPHSANWSCGDSFVDVNKSFSIVCAGVSELLSICATGHHNVNDI